MTTTFDKKKIQAFAEEFAKDIKTQSDLKSFTDALMKATVETALNAELTHHLGYEKHSEAGKGTGNSRPSRPRALYPQPLTQPGLAGAFEQKLTVSPSRIHLKP